MPRAASPRTGARPPRLTAAQRRARAARARRMRIALVTSAVAAVAVTVGGIAILIAAALNAFDSNAWSITVPPVTQSQTSGFDDEQLANAGVIIAAGRDLLMSPRDQAIAIMTAMGESSLRNIDYGDWETSGVTNPDGSATTSIGLFQQQDWWGSREERLDPHTAATLFYQRMVSEIPAAERQLLEPTEIAHRTQINADPQHYARYWPAAVRVLETLTGVSTGLAP